MVVRVLLIQGGTFYTGPQIEVQALDLAWRTLDASCLNPTAFTRQFGSPETRFCGASVSQAVKWCSVGHRVGSVPISAINLRAVGGDAIDLR